MRLSLRLLCLLFLPALALAAEEWWSAANRIAADDTAWRALAESFAAQPDGEARFREIRHFSMRSRPVELEGVARVSRAHGISLEYAGRDPRMVIVDDRGVLLREKGRDKAAPSDARAQAVNQAMRHILRLDVAALEKDFEVHGRREGTRWALALVPRRPDLSRAVAHIVVEGEEERVRRVELKRSERQVVEILIDRPAFRPGGFEAEELARYFRSKSS